MHQECTHISTINYNSTQNTATFAVCTTLLFVKGGEGIAIIMSACVCKQRRSSAFLSRFMMEYQQIWYEGSG